MTNTFTNSYTLGPLSNTVTDFWRLVWQEEVAVVAMVTNIKEGKQKKCKQYWPTEGSEDYGPFTVTLCDTQVLADYVIRTMQLEVSLHVMKMQ